MKTQLVVCMCLALGMTASVCAQTGSRTGGGSTAPSPTSRGATSPTGSQGLPDFQRPVFISGKVLMDDGTAPSEQVAIQTVCNANPKTVGYTDTRGRFSIDLMSRNNSASLADASQSSVDMGGASGGLNATGRAAGMNQSSMNSNSPSARVDRAASGLNEQSLMGCDLQAYLPGFRSDHLSLGARHTLDAPDVGAIILHRLANVQGNSISVTNALAPKDAKKAFDKGMSELHKGKLDNARREMETAVELYPKYAAAWFQLGMAQEKQNDVAAARKSYEQSLAADAKYVGPYMQLAMLAVRDKNWKEVADNTDRLLSLDPVDFLGAWYYNAVAHYQLRKLDTAEKSARQGLASDSAHHIAKFDELLAVILVEKHDYAGAAEHMKNYLRMAPDASDADVVKKQLAEVEKAAAAEAPAAPAKP
jgi:tetratricopeptide (TPR) repeat protein